MPSGSFTTLVGVASLLGGRWLSRPSAGPGPEAFPTAGANEFVCSCSCPVRELSLPPAAERGSCLGVGLTGFAAGVAASGCLCCLRAAAWPALAFLQGARLVVAPQPVVWAEQAPATVASLPLQLGPVTPTARRRHG